MKVPLAASERQGGGSKASPQDVSAATDLLNNTFMPDRISSSDVSHSVSHSALAPPLALARTQSGWYCEERGNRSEMSCRSVVT
jgi:hypothetical protein